MQKWTQQTFFCWAWWMQHVDTTIDCVKISIEIQLVLPSSAKELKIHGIMCNRGPVLHSACDLQVHKQTPSAGRWAAKSMCGWTDLWSRVDCSTVAFAYDLVKKDFDTVGIETPLMVCSFRHTDPRQVCSDQARCTTKMGEDEERQPHITFSRKWFDSISVQLARSTEL